VQLKLLIPAENFTNGKEMDFHFISNKIHK